MGDPFNPTGLSIKARACHLSAIRLQGSRLRASGAAVSAAALHAVGRGFESLLAHHPGSLIPNRYFGFKVLSCRRRVAFLDLLAIESYHASEGQSAFRAGRVRMR